MLLKKEIKALREALLSAKRPLFFYDDDPDGLCSYLLLHHFCKGRGRGILVNTTSTLDEKWARKVEEYSPDKVFVLDLPVLTQEFVDRVRVPLYWIDHHTPIELERVHCFNPRIRKPKAYIPTSDLVYQVTQDEKWLWQAAAGTLSDWAIPSFLSQAREKYPFLLPKKAPLGKMVFEQPMAVLIRIFSFLLKGPKKDVRTYIRTLLKIEDPLDLLEQRTAQGKFLYKRYKEVTSAYQKLFAQAVAQLDEKSPLLVYIYNEKKWSLTSDLSNELSYRYPKKVIIVARLSSGEYKCSLRAKKTILPALQTALSQVEGRGGGHDQACGAVISQRDWEVFLDLFSQEVEKC